MRYYFLVTVWGKHRDYLKDYCIPSLISPGNIPSLPERPLLLVACPEEDFRYLMESENWARLEAVCDVEWIPFDKPAPELSACREMGKAHLMLTERAFKDKAFGVVITPDFMLADGSMKFIEQKRQEGYKVVLTCALRSEEEALFQAMKDRGVDLNNGISRRDMAWCAVRSLHSRDKRYEWLSGYFCKTPSAIIWKLADEMLIYTLSWNVIFIDYGSLQKHDDSVMRDWTIDGDYIHKNFGLDEKIYVCQDSDEVIQVSWSPKADREVGLGKSNSWKENTQEGFQRDEVTKGGWFKTYFHSKSFDPLKKKIFYSPVKWHYEDLNEDWVSLESQCTKYMHEILDN